MVRRARDNRSAMGGEGGVRQQMDNPASSSSMGAPPIGTSSLALLLLFEVCWGDMSPTLARRIAEAATRDGLNHPSVDKIASAGANGTYSGNVWRDVKLRMIPSVLQSAMGSIRVPMKILGMRRQFDLDIIWPHVLFSRSSHWNKQVFLERFCGGNPVNLQFFWQSQKKHPSYSGHPMHAHSEGLHFATHGVPLSMHADGTNVISVGKKNAKHMDCISWSGLLDKQTDAATVNFIAVFVFVLNQISDVGFHTMDAVWSCLCWSFQCLYLGKHPTHDWRGREFDERDGHFYTNSGQSLAGGFFGTFWSGRFDLDFCTKGLKMPSHNASQCSKCPVGRFGDMLFTDVGDAATWIAARYSNLQYALKFPNRHLIYSIRFAIPHQPIRGKFPV